MSTASLINIDLTFLSTLPIEMISVIAKTLMLEDILSLNKIVGYDIDIDIDENTSYTTLFSRDEFEIIPAKYHKLCDIEYKVNEFEFPQYLNVHKLTCNHDVYDVSMLTNIKSLVCSSTYVSDLSNLTNLEYLQCDGSHVTDVSMLTKLIG